MNRNPILPAPNLPSVPDGRIHLPQDVPCLRPFYKHQNHLAAWLNLLKAKP